VSRFSTSFARAAVARDRAFGVSAQYRHGDDVLDVTLRLGSRDLGPKNTLGSEFAHVAVKEFQIAAAALAIDGEVFAPTPGDVINWTDPQNVQQEWCVFPLWNDQCFDRVDNAESDLRIFCAGSGDVSRITLPGAGGKPQTFVALAGSLRTTEVTVTLGSREQQSDRDICRLIVASPPGTFSTDQPLTVAIGNLSGEFYVKSIESVSPQSTRLEAWREKLTKIQRRGTETP
jgi:hypothetical protein